MPAVSTRSSSATAGGRVRTNTHMSLRPKKHQLFSEAHCSAAAARDLLRPNTRAGANAERSELRDRAPRRNNLRVDRQRPRDHNPSNEYLEEHCNHFSRKPLCFLVHTEAPHGATTLFPVLVVARRPLQADSVTHDCYKDDEHSPPRVRAPARLLSPFPPDSQQCGPLPARPHSRALPWLAHTTSQAVSGRANLRSESAAACPHGRAHATRVRYCPPIHEHLLRHALNIRTQRINTPGELLIIFASALQHRTIKNAPFTKRLPKISCKTAVL